VVHDVASNISQALGGGEKLPKLGSMGSGVGGGAGGVEGVAAEAAAEVAAAEGAAYVDVDAEEAVEERVRAAARVPPMTLASIAKGEVWFVKNMVLPFWVGSRRQISPATS